MINLETPSQKAWGEALFAAIMPTLAARKATGTGAAGAEGQGAAPMSKTI